MKYTQNNKINKIESRKSWIKKFWEWITLEDWQKAAVLLSKEARKENPQKYQKNKNIFVLVSFIQFILHFALSCFSISQKVENGNIPLGGIIATFLSLFLVITLLLTLCIYNISLFSIIYQERQKLKVKTK